MIGKKDLETEAGNAEFEKCCKTVERFIKSKIFSPDDREELVQETIKRILQMLSDDGNLKVNEGRFINTAKYVLLEFYRGKQKENERFLTAIADESDPPEQPLDADLQIEAHAEQKKRATFNECMIECFEERSLEEQILLWRYSFDEKHRLDDKEPDSNENFFRWLLDSIREIRDKFLPLQEDFPPITGNVRLRIFRLREKLRACLANCLARKKGFG